MSRVKVLAWVLATLAISYTHTVAYKAGKQNGIGIGATSAETVFKYLCEYGQRYGPYYCSRTVKT